MGDDVERQVGKWLYGTTCNMTFVRMWFGITSIYSTRTVARPVNQVRKKNI